MSEFTITRDLAAPVERVWSAFVDPAEYAAWIWPATWKTACDIDLRVGGRFRASSEVSGVAVSGTYVTVEPPTVLAMSWRWDDDPHETLLTLSFEPIAGGTRLTLVHSDFVDEDDRAGHEQGWNDCLDRLPAALAA